MWDPRVIYSTKICTVSAISIHMVHLVRICFFKKEILLRILLYHHVCISYRKINFLRVFFEYSRKATCVYVICMYNEREMTYTAQLACSSEKEGRKGFLGKFHRNLSFENSTLHIMMNISRCI